MTIRTVVAILIFESIILMMSFTALAEDEPSNPKAADAGSSPVDDMTGAAATPEKAHYANFRNKRGFGGPSAINVQLDKDDESNPAGGRDV